MMSTHYNYTSNDYLNNNNSSYFIPNNTGRITNRSTHGQYNITEKDFGDHKVLYYIPSTYESNYDLSQLDEEPFYKQKLTRYHSPRYIRRQHYYSYDHLDNDNYIDELPRISTRRYMYISPRQPQATKRVSYEPTPQTVEYIYEDGYRPRNEEIVEYIYEDNYKPKTEKIVEYIYEDRLPRQKYIEASKPIHHTTFTENLPSISRTTAFQSNDIKSPRRSKLKYQTPQITPRKIISQNTNQQKHISLRDVLAENRARRGSRIPIPRREVDQEELHDLPTYNKNFIKNDFLVHK